jgi:shikimate dehydrogenase
MMSNFEISGKTQICGIIGDPVEHTISPAMHNAAFREIGLDYLYVPFRVRRENLADAVKSLMALNIRGLNVTLPHKVSAMAYLDDIDELARYTGAINTIVNREGYLKGYNTDAPGFINAMAAEKVQPVGKNIVIIGAGGASRAISFILADKGADLTILNRHPESAQDMADRLSGLFRKNIQALELNRENLETVLAQAQILVNTTSVGMYPDSDVSPVPAALLKPGLVVVDIIYNPLKTKLLEEAQKRGAKIIGGIEMLVQQGAAAFELWTGQQAPVEIMRKAGLKAMGKNED